MRIGVAEYGMNLWCGGIYDLEDRLRGLKAAGYDGIEDLGAVSPSDAFHKSALCRKLGMDFSVCNGPNAETTLRWTVALGGSYVKVSADGRDFDSFCRNAERQGQLCRQWGMPVALHNHLDTWVETQKQVEEFLARCPSCGLELDTAHFALADGDSVDIITRHPDRIIALHIKDWLVTRPELGRDQWINRGRFCELGAGNIGLDNAAICRALVDAGFDGWLHVEQDTHLRDPLQDLAVSRQFLRDLGL
jgi:inosose dehydratase